MLREMLRAKVHRVTVTESDLDYEGSLTLDLDLMNAADLVPNEKIEVYNVTNGARFTTYAIEGMRGSGVCCVNGAAAHLVTVGDKLIVCAYAQVPEVELSAWRPRIVLVGERNSIRETKGIEKEGVRVP